MAQRNLTELVAGAVVLLVAAGFLGYAVAHTGRASVGGYTLHAKFDRIDGLSDGSDVRMAGVKVGSVTAATSWCRDQPVPCNASSPANTPAITVTLEPSPRAAGTSPSMR